MLGLGSVEDLTTVLRQVFQTVPLDVEIGYLARGRVALPPRLGRRVRHVPLGPEGFEGAIRTLADGSRRLVVLRPELRLVAGWWGALARDGAATPNACLTVGEDAMLLAFPAGLPADRVRRLPWSTPVGLRLPATPATVGGPTVRRSLGAVLIVKDEEAVLTDCLDALTPFVDEVVVYDTGSTDSTREIARVAGARVVEGFWDDDFAAARNRALEHARTDWVLSVDADEILSGEPAALRSAVDGCRDEAMCIDITSDSVEGGEHEVRSASVRVFQRAGTSWTEALHEYPVGPGGRRLRVGPPAPVTIRHSGYQVATFLAKDKHERNLTIARAAVARLDAGGRDAAAARTSLARACTAAGLWDEALDALSGVGTDVPADENLLASRAGAVAALVVGDLAAAARWIERLATGGEASARVDLLRAELAHRSGDLAAAGAHLAALVPSEDLWGVPYDLGEADPLRFQLALAEGADAARTELLAQLARGSAHVRLDFVVAVDETAPGTLDEVARTAPAAFLARSLREAVHLEVEQADRWAEALFLGGRETVGALSLASVIAPRLGLDRLLVWSLRLRESGRPEACPLRRVAEDEQAPLPERVAALSVLAGPLGDAEARDALVEVLDDLPDDLRALVADLAPELLAPVGPRA